MLNTMKFQIKLNNFHNINFNKYYLMSLINFKYLFLLFFIFLSIDNYAQRTHPLKKIKNLKKSVKKEIKDDIKEKTKSCTVYDGLFTFYQSKKDGKSFIEIDTSHIGNEFIYFSYFENGELLMLELSKEDIEDLKSLKLTSFLIGLISL